MIGLTDAEYSRRPEMTNLPQTDMNDDPASTVEELQQFLGTISDDIRNQVDMSPILAAPRLTSLRERLSEIAEELDWLRAAMESKD